MEEKLDGYNKNNEVVVQDRQWKGQISCWLCISEKWRLAGWGIGNGFN